jgi:drug/metabolite transporter (DMT)-like permease
MEANYTTSSLIRTTLSTSVRYIDVSIYQLLRGSGIIFVALMKQYVLRHRLYQFQWVGVVFNLVSVFLVGATAILNSNNDQSKDPNDALLGVVLVMAGAFVQALQFVFEEKVMTLDDDAAPPLLVIGMEGLWGSVLCLFVVYPLVYLLPGSDHGSYEDPFNTWYMLMHSTTLQWAFGIYFFAIFGYNLFAVLVTYSLNSVWHAILDNFRPVTVWCVDMFIYYGMPGLSGHGEAWTPYSWVQMVGMCVLLYGTAIYNAPNAGSVKLEGKWWQLWINMTREYNEIEVEMEEAAASAEWDDRQAAFKQRHVSSFAQRSPMVSVHTQALHGLGSHNI